jgi:hypothetical protein
MFAPKGEHPLTRSAARRIRDGALRGHGLYTALGRALWTAPWRGLHFSRLCVARDLGWCDHETIEALVGFCSPILLRPGFFLCTLDYEPANSVHKKHNTRRYGHPFAGAPGLSGWGYADFHGAGVNFLITEF